MIVQPTTTTANAEVEMTGSLDSSRPLSIFNYIDYRQYLNDYFTDLKIKKPRFSIRAFNRHAGIKGKSYLSMVLKGQRNISLGSVDKFIKGLRLSDHEAAYFGNMVSYQNSKVERDQDHSFEQMALLRSQKSGQALPRDEFCFLSKPLVGVIYEMANLPGFNDDTAWISQRLLQPAAEEAILEAIGVLFRLRLLIKNDMGQVSIGDGKVPCQTTMQATEQFNHQRKLLRQAEQVLLLGQKDKIHHKNLTVSVPESASKGVKEIMDRYLKEVENYVDRFEESADQVFQVQLQMYPVTKT